jgi:hypothetical protein
MSPCSPESRRRRPKGSPVPGGITGPFCHGGYTRKYRDLDLEVGALDAGLTTLLCKKLLLRNSKKRKLDSPIE